MHYFSPGRHFMIQTECKSEGLKNDPFGDKTKYRNNNGKIKVVVTIFIILTFSHTFASNIYSQKREVKASFCELSLPEFIKQANATFGNRYFFRLNKDNKPTKIVRLGGYDYIKDEVAESCIRKWIFKNFEENTPFVVNFRWRHMYGWQPVLITTKGFSKAVKPTKKY